MSPQQILFIVTAATILGSALMVVTARNLIHCALWLILALFGVAVMFVLLSAGFLAIAQVVVYIGSIAILMIFAVMMTRYLGKDNATQVNSTWWIAGILSVLLFGGLTWMLSAWQGFQTQLPNMPDGADPLKSLGIALVAPNAYVLPFELASVLLLAAMVGAIMIAREKKLS